MSDIPFGEVFLVLRLLGAYASENSDEMWIEMDTIIFSSGLLDLPVLLVYSTLSMAKHYSLQKIDWASDSLKRVD